MRLPCYCSTFELGRKEASKIIHDEQLFCSPACLLKYIQETEPKPSNLDTLENRTYVSEPYECWDKVTKKYYRSWFEVYLARFFTFNRLDHQYEACTFRIGSKYYTPDFYLPEKRLHFECKGAWLSGSRKKYLAAREQINIILLPSYLQKIFKKEFGLNDEIIS